MDTITLQNIELSCILGCFPEERTQRRKVILSVTLYTDTSAAAASDDLKDAVDYFELTNKLRQYAETSSFRLIEALAENLAGICLETPRVFEVALTVTKPAPCPFLGSANITIHRAKTKN